MGTGEMSSTDEYSVFPNPFSAGQALAITLENDFIGQVKVEMMQPDGRVIDHFFIEKNERKVTRVLPDFPYLDNASTMGWMVRISDELHVQTKLILKL